MPMAVAMVPPCTAYPWGLRRRLRSALRESRHNEPFLRGLNDPDDDPEDSMKCFSALMALCLAACGAADRRHPPSDREEGPRKVERDYGKPAAEVWRAARAAIEEMELTIDDDRHDQLGGRIVARRASGDRLTVDVVSLDEHRTKVVVEVDPGNGNLASMVH